MTNRLFHLCLTALLAVSLSFSVIGRKAAAQQDICGEMSDLQCTKIVRGLHEWSELVQDRIKVLNWEYVGPANSLDRQEIFNSVTDNNLARFPITDKEGRIVATIPLVDVASDLKISPDTIGTWKKEIRSLLENLEHVARINWQEKGVEFSSTVLILRSYPYVYDNLLSNVTIYESSNSCIHEKAYWIWRSLRGEIFIDLIADCSRLQTRCRHSAEGWMTIGSKHMKVEGPRLDFRRDDGKGVCVILANARIQIARIDQTCLCKTFLDSSLRWNDWCCPKMTE